MVIITPLSSGEHLHYIDIRRIIRPPSTAAGAAARALLDELFTVVDNSEVVNKVRVKNSYQHKYLGLGRPKIRKT